MCLGHRKSKKKKKDSKNEQPPRESIRSLNKEWRKTSKYSQLTSSFLLSSNFWDFTHTIGKYHIPLQLGGGTLIFWRKFLRGWTIFIFMEGHLYIGGLICLDFKGVGNLNTAWSAFIKRYFPFIDNGLLDIGRNMESTTGHENCSILTKKLHEIVALVKKLMRISKVNAKLC